MEKKTLAVRHAEKPSTAKEEEEDEEEDEEEEPLEKEVTDFIQNASGRKRTQREVTNFITDASKSNTTNENRMVAAALMLRDEFNHAGLIEDWPKVEVGECGGMGLGLFASEDIPKDNVCVIYGGPYLPSKDGVSSTHSLFEVDTSDEHQGHSVIDGEIVSVMIEKLRQKGLPEREKERKLRLQLLLSVSGALMNASSSKPRDIQNASQDTSNVKKAEGNIMTVKVDGVTYAGRLFCAAWNISKGEQILWNYAWKKPETGGQSYVDTEYLTRIKQHEKMEYEKEKKNKRRRITPTTL